MKVKEDSEEQLLKWTNSVASCSQHSLGEKLSNNPGKHCLDFKAIKYPVIAKSIPTLPKKHGATGGLGGFSQAHFFATLRF